MVTWLLGYARNFTTDTLLVNISQSSRTKDRLFSFLFPQQIGTELSHDVLNPAHVSYYLANNHTLGTCFSSRKRWGYGQVFSHENTFHFKTVRESHPSYGSSSHIININLLLSKIVILTQNNLVNHFWNDACHDNVHAVILDYLSVRFLLDFLV